MLEPVCSIVRVHPFRHALFAARGSIFLTRMAKAIWMLVVAQLFHALVIPIRMSGLQCIRRLIRLPMPIPGSFHPMRWKNWPTNCSRRHLKASTRSILFPADQRRPKQPLKWRASIFWRSASRTANTSLPVGNPITAILWVRFRWVAICGGANSLSRF